MSFSVFISNSLFLYCNNILLSNNINYGYLNGIIDNTNKKIYILSISKEKEINNSLLPYPIINIGIFCISNNSNNSIKEYIENNEEKQSKENLIFPFILLEFTDNISDSNIYFISNNNNKDIIKYEILSSDKLEEMWKEKLISLSFSLHLHSINNKTNISNTLINYLSNNKDSIAFSITNQENDTKIISSSNQQTIDDLFIKKDIIQSTNDNKTKKNNKKKNNKKKKGKKPKQPQYDLPDLNFGGKKDIEIQKYDNIYNISLLVNISSLNTTNEMKLSFSKELYEENDNNYNINTCFYVYKDNNISNILSNIINQIIKLLQLSQEYLLNNSNHNSSISSSLFKPNLFSHPICCFYSIQDDNEMLYDTRLQFHNNYLLPQNRPIFKLSNIYSLLTNKDNNSRLINVHEGLSPKLIGKEYLIQGCYEYYHYMQDKINDKGWGCAYRSLQTICSWFRLQGYTSKDDPNHKEIQQVLVSMGDKPASFIGSSKWIGAFEISLCLDHFYGITSKIINCNSGSEIPSKARELQHHFINQGTPIMIGGGVLAYTLLGIDFNENTGETKFLILDPHYVGKEDINIIQEAGWCNWKEASLFRKDAFYNLCLPQCPEGI